MKVIKAVLAIVATAAIGLGFANSASAHNHTITAPCDGALSVSLDSYGGGQGNHITVTLGGSVVADANFGASFSGSWTPTSYPTSYKVVVTAADSNDDSFTTTDTIKACKETPPSTSTPSTSTVSPSTSSAPSTSTTTTASTAPSAASTTTASSTVPGTTASVTPSTRTSAPPSGKLPSTGRDYKPVALVALLLIGAGIFLVKRSTVSPPR